jgi:hypothetical protein
MLKKLALIALASGTILTAAPAPQAEAGRVYVGYRAGPVYAYRPYYYRRPHVRPIYSYGYVSRPVYYGYGYGDGCYWMKRRAVHTGSHYWWRRYRDCRGW